MSEDILSVQSLSWCVGAKTILDDINFTVKRGQFVGLIGPNGAGKSSLLRCLYRHLKPTKGHVLLNGHNIWQGSLKENARRVAVILQEGEVPFGVRVKDVVAMGLTPHKSLWDFDTAADRARIDRAIAQVDLTALRNDVFSHLSGGEKQRVMVARAIVQQPQLLLMDEPTNHLDVHYQSEVLQLAQDLGITVLASIHDLNLASTFCDSLLVIDKGRLVGGGTPSEVLTEDMISTTFNTCSLVDRHPLYDNPRITYAYRTHEPVTSHGKKIEGGG